MRVDEFAVLLVNLLDDGQAVAVQAFAGDETVFIADFVQREGEVEAFAAPTSVHSVSISAASGRSGRK